MGICFSKKKDNSKKNPFHFTAKPPLPRSEDTQSKSPPPVEEETVKEVLSETQKPPTFPKFEEDKKKEKMEESAACSINGYDEIPETSDICSCTESSSVSTIAEKKPEEEEEGEVEMQLKEAKFHQKRSLSGDFSYSSEKSQNSPARRSSPSPGRKTLVRDLGVMNPAWIPSSSRLRSPAMRNDLGRGYSERKADRSLSQIPAELPEEDGRKMEKRKDLSMNESLENPMVSLECFIFL